LLESVLQKIVDRPGVQGVVLSDSQGEPIYSFGGEQADQLQLLGAYQGVLMSAVERLLESEDRTVITICDTGSILTHHLKDGYFISVILAPEMHFAEAQFHLSQVYPALIREL
jgi:hypothetical protein